MLVLEPDEYKSNYDKISDSISNSAKRNIKIICVSKSHPVDSLINAYQSGLRVFGENYVQEMVDKYESISGVIKKNIEWHFIGHLQTNKVKYIAPFVDYIHSVDKLKLAQEIDKRANENNRNINILLQVNTSDEDSKSGCKINEAEQIIEQMLNLKNIKIVGLMTISGLESSDEERNSQFKELCNLQKRINSNLNINLTELSMGMTDDYHLAIDAGATMIRIGTAIFGKREYIK